MSVPYFKMWYSRHRCRLWKKYTNLGPFINVRGCITKINQGPPFVKYLISLICLSHNYSFPTLGTHLSTMETKLYIPMWIIVEGRRPKCWILSQVLIFVIRVVKMFFPTVSVPSGHRHTSNNICIIETNLYVNKWLKSLYLEEGPLTKCCCELNALGVLAKNIGLPSAGLG